jgi:hypothetical protein
MVNSLSCVCLALLQQEFLQEHHTANVGILPLSDVGPSSPSLPSSSSRILRGFGGEESRLSRLALLLRGQSHERRLPLAAREARDRLEERLRAAALVPPRRATSSASGNAQYNISVLFSDEEDESLWSDDDDWERSMREWLSAWAPSLEDRSQPELFPSNGRLGSIGQRPLPPPRTFKPREGMSQEAIDAINRETYGPKQADEDQQEDCPVCLEGFLLGQALLALPCKHRFHPDCLTPWLQAHEQCPYCRAHIEGGSAATQDRDHQMTQSSSSQNDSLMSWVTVLEQGMSHLNHAG